MIKKTHPTELISQLIIFAVRFIGSMATCFLIGLHCCIQIGFYPNLLITSKIKKILVLVYIIHIENWPVQQKCFGLFRDCFEATRVYLQLCQHPVVNFCHAICFHEDNSTKSQTLWCVYDCKINKSLIYLE